MENKMKKDLEEREKQRDGERHIRRNNEGEREKMRKNETVK